MKKNNKIMEEKKKKKEIIDQNCRIHFKNLHDFFLREICFHHLENTNYKEI